MNVSLTQELEKMVNKKVKSGLYYSASEVIREGLRLLWEKDILRDRRLEGLRQDLKAGIKQADKREVVALDIEAVKAQGRKELKKKAVS